MKNFQKMVVTLIGMVIFVSMGTVFASLTYEKEANQLNNIGLYMGISEEEFVPDLDTTLDRQTGVVMLLRMFGQEEEAKLLTEKEVNTSLAKFKDAGTIADWAKNQVAYAANKNIVVGYAEDLTFRPDAGLNGKAYASLILRQLGYDGVNYQEATKKLAQIGGLSNAQAEFFNSDNTINKDSLVGISYGSLQAKINKTDKKLVEDLVEKGIISEEKLKEIEIAYLEKSTEDNETRFIVMENEEDKKNEKNPKVSVRLKGSVIISVKRKVGSHLITNAEIIVGENVSDEGFAIWVGKSGTETAITGLKGVDFQLKKGENIIPIQIYEDGEGYYFITNGKMTDFVPFSGEYTLRLIKKWYHTEDTEVIIPEYIMPE